MTSIADAIVAIADAPPPRAAERDTGTAFFIGLADRGKVAGQITPADAVHSLGEWVAKFGAVQTYNGNEYAAVEGFFNEGGSTLYFSRFAGPSAVRASAAVPTSSSQFTAIAKGPGSYGNSLKVGVQSGVVTIKDGTTVIETSPTLASVAELQAWATNFSTSIDVTPIGSGALTNTADVTLAGGADDRASVTDTERSAALDRLGKDLGPGQVAAPGDTRTAMHAVLINHAVARNRFALCDCPDSATAATAAAPGTTARALGRATGSNRPLASLAAFLGDWLPITGLAVGQLRIAPPSGHYAGLCARNDAAGNPAHAIAGPQSYLRTALGTHYARSEADRQTFADAGIVPFIVDDGLVQPYDDINPVDPTVDPEWWSIGGSRFLMRVIDDARSIAKAFMWDPVAGTADYVGYKGALEGYLARWLGIALFGDNPADAYRVVTDSSVNTPATVQQKKLLAALSLHIAGSPRIAQITITNTPLTEAL